MTSINSTHVDKKSEIPRTTGMTLTLHSDYTVVKRVLHITCLIGVLYSIGFASFQLSALHDLTRSQHSAIGTTTTRYTAEKNHAEFFAQQWAAEAFQDPVEKDTLIQLWSGLPAIKFVAVYSETGFLIRQAPKNTSLKEVISNYPRGIVTSAAYQGETSTGTLVMFVDESPFESIVITQKQLLLKILLAYTFIGTVVGCYLFRGFRYFRPKTRQ